MGRLGSGFWALAVPVVLSSCAAAQVRPASLYEARAAQVMHSREPQPAAVTVLQLPRGGFPYSAMQKFEGRLAVDSSGCLLIDSAGVKYLVLWPHDVRITGDARYPIISNSKDFRFAIGDNVVLRGSGSGPIRVTELGGIPVPQPCRSYSTIIVDAGGVGGH